MAVIFTDHHNMPDSIQDAMLLTTKEEKASALKNLTVALHSGVMWVEIVKVSRGYCVESWLLEWIIRNL